LVNDLVLSQGHTPGTVRDISRDEDIWIICYEINTTMLVVCLSLKYGEICKNSTNLNIKFIEVLWQHILGVESNVMYCFLANLINFSAMGEF